MSGLYVVNLGCKVNRIESDSISALAKRANWLASSKETASLIVVNTCAVTSEAYKKTRKAIHQVLRANPQALIVATGCAAALYADDFNSMDDRIHIVPKHKLELFVSKQIDALSNTDVVTYNSEDSSLFALRVGEHFPTRVGIKIQDGCAGSCTYCIVHTARGPVWSKPKEAVESEACAYLQNNVKELVLAGINLGSYHDGPYNLAALVGSLLKQTAGVDDYGNPLLRIRLSSIEPCDVSDELIELLASQNGRLCRHLHIPLQSGSSKVLHEMNRPYDAEVFLALVNRIKQAVPNISLSTDIIVGFPGETENDFAETIALSSACAFSKIHVFPYSMREGTPAALRSDQIAPEVKQQRARELRELSDILRDTDRRLRAGSKELVVVEQKGHGLSESYHTITLDESLQSGFMIPMIL